MPYINIHTHVFNVKNAPEKFLSLFMPERIGRWLDTITNTEAGVSATTGIISRVGNHGKRYASFLSIGKSKSQRDIFEKLMSQYPDEDMKFVALSMYMEELGAGPSLSGYYGQLQELINLKKSYPDKIILFLGIDPRWLSNGEALLQETINLFSQKVEKAGRSYNVFSGLKMYPSTGFYAFDERLMPVFEWAADNGVPIMTHCSYLGGIYNNQLDKSPELLNGNVAFGYNCTYTDYCKKNNLVPPRFISEAPVIKRLLGIAKQHRNKNSCSYFLEPASFEPVLEYFRKKGKALKICFAHFGGEKQMKEMGSGSNLPFGVKPKNWFSQITELMEKYSSVYTDVSYTLQDVSLHKKMLEEAQNSNYGTRIMFGTDFFMTEKDKNEYDNYRDFRNASKQKTNQQTGQNLWDQMAEKATSEFLRGRFYDL